MGCRISGTWLLCIGLLLGAAAPAAEPEATEPAAVPLEPLLTPAASELEAALAKLVQPRFDNTPLATVLQYFRTRGGVPIVLDPAAASVAEQARVSLESPRPEKPGAGGGMTLRDALRAALKPAGLSFQTERGALFISTPKRLAEIQAREKPLDLASVPEPLRQRISLQLDAEPLPYVLDLIAKTVGTSIVMDQRERFELEEGKVTLSADQLVAAQALRFVLRQHGLDFEPMGEALFVARAETLKSGYRLAPVDDPQLAAKLQKPISYACIDRPLTAVLDDLGALVELTLKYETPPDRRPPRLTFEVRNLPLSTTLDLLVRTARLNAAIENGEIKLSAGQAAGR